jgi:uncharacterized protein YaaQ
MAITLDGTLGITSPAETVQGALTTTGNTILGDATTDTLNVGAGGLVKDASGNVGIGTSSPTSKLDVLSTSGANIVYSRNTGTTSSDSSQMHCVSGSVILQSYAYNFAGEAVTGTQSNHPFVFRTNSAERMRIDASGNLLVGGTSNAVGARAIIENASGDQVGIRYTGIATYYLNATSGGALAINKDGTERMRIDSSGNLLVGDAVGGQATRLRMRYGAGQSWGCGPLDAAVNNFYVVNTAGTGVFLTSGNTSWTANSDERLKTDLKPIENAVEKVNQLRSVTGRYKTDEEGTSRSFLIAQDVQKVFPEAVNVQEDEIGTLGVQYTEVIPLLVASLKEQQVQITDMSLMIANANAMIQELKAIVDAQAVRIAALEA